MNDRQAHANLLRAAVKGLAALRSGRHFLDAEALLQEAIRDSACALMVKQVSIPAPVKPKGGEWWRHVGAAVSLIVLFLFLAFGGSEPVVPRGESAFPPPPVETAR